MSQEKLRMSYGPPMSERVSRRERAAGRLGSVLGVVGATAVFASAVVLAVVFHNMAQNSNIMAEKVNRMEQEMDNMMMEMVSLKEKGSSDREAITKLQARAERDQQETMALRERVAVVEAQIHGGNFPPNQAEQQSFHTGSVLNPQADDVSVVDSELLSKNDSVGGLLRRRKRDAPTPNWVRLPIGPSDSRCFSPIQAVSPDETDGTGYLVRLVLPAFLIQPDKKEEPGPPGPRGRPAQGTSNGQELKGQKGDMGSIGAQGPEGLKGDRGPIGLQGSKGMKGGRGSTGQQGTAGDRGPIGLQGAKGMKGDMGSTGLQGAKGDKGSTGLQGAKGDRGSTGPRGSKGVRGPTGIQGAKGQKGYRGYTGSTGPRGPGYAGGTSYSHPGGGTNYQCLPTDPQWGRYQAGHQRWRAYLYGAEYELESNGVPFGSASLDDDDVPCAVCYVPTRGSKLMIPARNTCYSGWTREYRGYLMAEDHTVHAKEFVCVDESPETVAGGHADHIGAGLYPVEAVCGSLPCPRYVNGRELTCVVCTK
uniref:Collagen IV NC1 domain-containing protein n=1 Tax=Branchiostoma floridae TaxID=7739 RepID=C3ZM63_BRAFL|eukprot:XP_002590308.1 hypothetical protein BRAFLDRAFT_76561 [Branchiostoma floridae]